MKNRYALFIAAAAVVSLTLTACGSASAPAPTVTVTEAPVSSPSDNYLNQLAATGDPTILAMADSDLLDIGNSTCEVLASGTTITEIAVYLVQNGGFTNSQYASIGRILGAAVYNLCPEYAYQINQLSNNY